MGNTWENLHFLWSSPLGKAGRPFLVPTLQHHWSFSSRAYPKKSQLASGPWQSLIVGSSQLCWSRKNYDIHDTCCSTHPFLCRPRTTVSRLWSFVRSKPVFGSFIQWAAVNRWRLRFSQISYIQLSKMRNILWKYTWIWGSPHTCASHSSWPRKPEIDPVKCFV